jgi:anti-anti-sigma factor
MIAARSGPAPAGVGVSETYHNVEVTPLPDPGAGVALSGELDMSDAEAVHGLLTRLATAAAPAAVLVDLRGLAFIDSHGIRALFFARDDAERAGGRITVCSDGPVRRTLEMVDAGSAFEIVPEPPTGER